MSTAIGVSIPELSTAIAEAADCIGAIDRVLGKIVRLLDRRKLRAVSTRLNELQERSTKLKSAQHTIDLQIAAIETKIEELEGHKDFRAIDVLSFGLGYLVRRGTVGIHQAYLGKVQTTCQRRIRKLEKRIASVQCRIAQVERALKRLSQKEHPSLMARILLWLQLFKNAISAIIGVITGNVVSAICSLQGIYLASDAIR